MKISNQLINPYLEKLRSEFEELDKELSLRGGAEEVVPLATMTQTKINQINELSHSVNNGTLSEKAEDVEQFQDNFRRLKLDLRFARRRWLRLLSNEARDRKARGKRTYAATFAA
jgi:hypothetical protein